VVTGIPGPVHGSDDREGWLAHWPVVRLSLLDAAAGGALQDVSSIDVATVALHSQPLELQSRPQHDGDKVMVVGHGRDEAQLVPCSCDGDAAASTDVGRAATKSARACACSTLHRRSSAAASYWPTQAARGCIGRPAIGRRPARSAARQLAPRSARARRAGLERGKGLIHPVHPRFGGAGSLPPPQQPKATRSTRRCVRAHHVTERCSRSGSGRASGRSQLSTRVVITP
jgi:hypothetical protein